MRTRGRLLAVLAIAVLGLSACGRSSAPKSGGSLAPGADGDDAKAAPALGFPQLATKNTIRVAGADPIADAAAVARAVFPASAPAARPGAVALADVADWRAALAASVLMAPPLRAPTLLGDPKGLPDATADALRALAPRGAAKAKNVQAIRIGAVGRAEGLRTADLVGRDAFELARAVDAYQAEAAGEASDTVLVVSADAPAFAMPAASWAAKSGDPILFVTRDTLPEPTRIALTQHERPKIVVLGPASVIGAAVTEQLRKLGTVTRIEGPDPQANAIAFARFTDGDFGWGVTDPGHGLVFASPKRPADVAAAAPLASSGQYGPLLLVAADGQPTTGLVDYLLDIQPGYTGDPARGVYNHGWILGDASAVTDAAQARIDGLLEIAPVNVQSEESSP